MNMTSNSYNEILHYLKLDSVYYSRSTLGGEKWGVAVPAYDNTSMFHIVTKGQCWIEINQQRLALKSGDVLFISRACGHVVKGCPSANTVDLLSLPVKTVSKFYETLELNPKAEEQTIILCGVVKITHPAGERLIHEMPDVIHIKQQDHLFGHMIGDIVSLMFREASGEYLGGEAVITRLADILMIQTIRHWVEQEHALHGNWLKAMKDKKIGQALVCMHTQPEKAWTIESLGKTVGMSRTAFSNRFHQLLGETVLSYLTQWRMNLAVMRIRQGETVDLDFMASLGYQSESAFRRTFKKVMGMNISEFKNK